MDAAPEPFRPPRLLSPPDLELLRDATRRAIERTRADLERVQSVLRASGTGELALRAHVGHDVLVPFAPRRADPLAAGHADGDPLDGGPREN